MDPSDAPAGPGRAPLTGGLVLVCLGSLAAYALGELWRPSGHPVAMVYDLVTFDAVYLFGAAVCRRTALHRTDDRLVWNALAVALAAVALSTTLYTVALAPAAEHLPSWLLVALWAPVYPAMGVALVGVVRSRVGTPHPSMWFDALTGACGAVIFAVTLLPSLVSAPDGRLAAVQLYPIADTLLLAAVSAVCAVMGFRRDWPLILIIAGLLCTLGADALLLNRVVQGEVAVDGPLTLVWMAGATCTALSAHVAGRMPGIVPVDADPVARLSWRVAFVPLGASVMSVAVLVSTWGSAGLGIAGWAAVTCLLATLARTAMSVQELRGLHDIREQARTDELTGLPNRRALLERTRAALGAPGDGRPVALLLLDLDGFKEVNDSLGHSAGDDLLRMIGPRLWPELGRGDLLARLGGDEFALLLPGTGLDDAIARAERVRALVLEPFVVHGVRLHVGVSVGIATGPVPAATVTELLRCADVAMYEAKNSRDGVRSYVPDARAGGGDRLRTMEDLRTALDAGQLLVHLQPQVALHGRAVVGVEALVRWQHPERGLLSPAVVLPAAEQAGLMRPLTDVVLGLALEAAARWWPERAVPVSVNLSAASVTDLELPATVIRHLQDHGLPPEALTLELVEDTLMADPDRGRTVLGELRRLGIRTSIDDYGTGYSSLAYLRHLPADELKLDRSLTHDAGRDVRATAIVRHTVGLAHDLGLSLVAEGVEDEETAAVLAALGCDVAQGWAIARPMPVEHFLGWLADRPAAPSRAPRVPAPRRPATYRSQGSPSTAP